MLAKAATLGADELVLALEDAVVPSAKPQARRQVVAALQELLCTEVRVNEVGSRVVLDHVRDLVTAPVPPASLVLPQVDSRDDVAFLDRLLLGLKQLTGRAAPLGEHIEEVLVDVLGLSGGQVADLFDRGMAAPTFELAPA